MLDPSLLPYLPYPATWEGYGHTAAPTHRTHETRGGRPRQRRVAARSTLRVKAAWTLSSAGYAVFVGFYEHATANALPFAVDAIAEGDTSRCAARFIPGSLTQTSLDGGSWRVAAELDVVPNVFSVAHDEAIVMLFEAYGTGMGPTLAALAALANTIMPAEL